MRAVGSGKVDLDEPAAIGAGHRTAGPTGLSIMTQPGQLAMADVAQLMISISDKPPGETPACSAPSGQTTPAPHQPATITICNRQGSPRNSRAL
jgi:hypothetical protein